MTLRSLKNQPPCLLLFLLILFQFFSCSSDPAPLTLGTNTWSGYEMLYLARKKAYYPITQVQLKEFPSTTEVIRSFKNGLIDGAALTLDETLELAGYQIPFEILLLVDASNGADAVISRHPYELSRDIAGKTIGCENTAIGAFMATRFLDHCRLNWKEVQILPLNYDEHESAYQNQKVDILVTFEPVLTRLRNSGARVLFDSSQIPGEIIDVLIVRTDRIRSKKSQIRTLIRGYFKALNDWTHDPDNSALLIKDRLKMSPDETLRSFQTIHLYSFEENIRLTSPDNPMIPERFRSLQKIMMERSLITGNVPYPQIRPVTYFLKETYEDRF